MPCKDGCSELTPCLVRLPEVSQVSPQAFAADTAGEICSAPGSRCDGWKKAVAAGGARSRFDFTDTTLCVTGPVDDGFFSRMTVLLAHARWARLVGLPVRVAYASPQDHYYNSLSMTGRDGWMQYFEAIDEHPAASTHVQLSCTAAAYAFDLWGYYARCTRQAQLKQITERAQLMQSLNVRPRHNLVQEAEAWWRSNVESLGAERPVLGVHLRGTDKLAVGNVGNGLHHDLIYKVVPLTHAFLGSHTNAIVFLATDDTRYLGYYRQLLANSSCTSAVPVVWRHEALRSSSKRNAGVHARSSKHAERLGRDAMLDALLLSRTNFLVKSISGLSDYAMAFSPGRRLINNSFDLSVKSNDGGQPRGHWIPEHLFRGHDWAGRGCSATGA